MMSRYIHSLRIFLRSTGLATLGLLVLWSGLQTTTTYAISQGDLDSLRNNTTFFDPDATECTDNSGGTVLVGSDDKEKTFNFLIGKNLTPIAAAAIMGNLMEESAGISPTLVEPYTDKNTTPPTVHQAAFSLFIPDYAKGNAGYGIAQWTDPGRQSGLISMAHDEGLAMSADGKQQVVGDLRVQLDYLWKEANTTRSKALVDLKQTAAESDPDKALEDATRAWMDGYEAPGAPNFPVRLNDAKDALARFGKQAATNVASASGNCGASTNFATDFHVYKQCDYYTDYSSSQAERDEARAWSNTAYGDGTVCGSGCGIAAMAMAITNMTGKHVTPDQTATWGHAHGTGSGWGSDGNALIRVFAGGDPQWGPLKGGLIGTGTDVMKDIDQVNAVLRRGGLVLMRGHMDSGHSEYYDATQHTRFPGPFSVGGHFVIIRAVTPEGTWLVGNSGGWPDNAKYAPTWIYAHTTVHDTWSIEKA